MSSPHSEQIPNDFIAEETQRSTANLTARPESGGRGPEAEARLGARVLEITELIQHSPDRLAVDMGRPADQRTEYDTERAHLVANTINAAMTYQAKNNAHRERHGTTHRPLGKRHETAALSIAQGTATAQQVYDRNPDGAGNNGVRLAQSWRREKPFKASWFSRR